MQKAWTPPARWLFLVATLLGLFSTAQAYRLTALDYFKIPESIDVRSLLVLNLAYWYIPAALTVPVFRLAHRFPLDTGRWALALFVHVFAAVTFSVVHLAGMIGVRLMLWPAAGKPPSIDWPTFVQRQFLRNLDWALMTYAAIVGLSYALSYYREARARTLRAAQLEARLMEARLKTLEAELHPHFLFNTLHAISTLVHSNPESADRMISRLSDLLRLTFDRSGAPRIALQEELEFLQKYLEIEQVRFQDRLAVRIDVDAEALDAEVPRLILQPLVENAIKHGVAPRRGEGLIQISARVTGNVLWMEVRDNGVGLSGGARALLHSGVGLANTRDRLECLYGDRQRLAFSDGNGGLAVELQIPLHRVAAGAEPCVA